MGAVNNGKGNANENYNHHKSHLQISVFHAEKNLSCKVDRISQTLPYLW